MLSSTHLFTLLRKATLLTCLSIFLSYEATANIRNLTRDNTSIADAEFEASAGPIPKPAITVDASANWAYVGGSFKLICEVTFDGESVQCEWSFPAEFEKRGRVNQMRSQGVTQNWRHARNILTVKSAALSDAGNYTCNCTTDGYRYYNHSSVDVNVSPSMGQIRVADSIMPEEIITVNEGDDVLIFNISFGFFPNASAMLYHVSRPFYRGVRSAPLQLCDVKDGEGLCKSIAEAKEVVISDDGHETIILELYNVSLSDSGTYVLIVTAAGTIKSFTGELRVRRDVAIQIIRLRALDFRYLEVNTTYELGCLATGYPIGESFRWYFKSDTSDGWKHAVGHNAYGPTSNRIFRGTWELATILTTVARTSGRYCCLPDAPNLKQVAVKDYCSAPNAPIRHYRVSEIAYVDKGISLRILHRKEEYLEGDKLIIQCKIHSSNFRFQGSPWSFVDRNGQHHKQLDLPDKFVEKTWSTQYYKASELVITHLTLEDNERFFCSVYNVDNNAAENRTVGLVVLTEGRCKPGQFQCEDGQCITGSLVCDDNDDCSDQSDEQKCEFPEPGHGPPSYLQARRGETVTIVCGASGFPVPSISWSRTWGQTCGAPRCTQRTRAVSQTEAKGELTIRDVDIRDDGPYKCEAENQFGRIVLVPNCFLEVTDVARGEKGISLHILDNQKAYVEGDDVKILCHVDYNFPVGPLRMKSISWSFLDGNGRSHKQLEQRDKFTVKNWFRASELTVKNLTLNDSGHFVCSASSLRNRVSEDRIGMVVHEQIKPHFNIQRSTTNTHSGMGGTSLELNCTVDAGRPRPTVVWYYENRSLTIGEGMSVHNDGQVLRFSSLSADNAGHYFCEASNSAGTANHSIILSVKDTARDDSHISLRIMDRKEAYLEGDEVRIRCHIHQPRFQFRSWSFTSKNSHRQKQLDGDRFVEKNWYRTSELTVKNLTVEDNGHFVCSASTLDHKKLEIQVQTIRLEVLEKIKPAFNANHSTARTHSGIQGTTIDLRCAIEEGRPRPKVTWYYIMKKLKIESGISVRDDGQVLRFNNLNSSNAGDYHCKARNSKGTAGYDIHLSVKEQVKPRFNHGGSTPKTYSGIEGRLLELKCEIGAGIPRPIVTWYYEDEKIKVGEGISVHDDGEVLRFSTLNSSNAGDYLCKASSSAGTAIYDIHLTVKANIHASNEQQLFPKAGIGVLVAIGMVVLIGLVSLTAFVIISKRSEHKKIEKLSELHTTLMTSARTPILKRRSTILDPQQPLLPQVDNLPYDMRYELPYRCLTRGKVLGEGNFGKVLDGTLRTDKSEVSVAVKVPRNGMDREQQRQLLCELKIMIHIGSHPHIVGLFGAVTTRMVKGQLYVVVELCAKGSLDKHLKKSRGRFVCEMVEAPMTPVAEGEELEGYLTPNSISSSGSGWKYRAEVQPDWPEELNMRRSLDHETLATSDLISYAYQTSRGLEFLASKGVIHRDVAARNVLLTAENVIKITDFGLTLESELDAKQCSDDTPMPLRWMAIESLKRKEFTVKSDVWSFGVLTWEIFTLAQQPYADQPFEIGNFVSRVEQGDRLAKPPHAPGPIYKLMMSCWEKKPSERPTFSELKYNLSSHLRRASMQVYQNLEVLDRLPIYDPLHPQPPRPLKPDADYIVLNQTRYDSEQDMYTSPHDNAEDVELESLLPAPLPPLNGSAISETDGDDCTSAGVNVN